MLKRKKDQDIRQISDLAVVFLETMKEIASRGKDFSRDEITGLLSTRSDIKSLIAHATAADGKSASGATSKAASFLARGDAGSPEQKETLLKMGELQKVLDQERDFDKRMSLMLLNLCQVESNEHCSDVLDQYKELLVENGDISRKEQTLADLKNHILRNDIATQERQRNAPKKTFLSRLTSPRKDIALDSFKDCYIDLLEEMKNIIGAECSKELDVIASQIRESDDVDFILSQRTAIVGVVEKFASRINSERANVTLFIKEIGEKLAELEKNFGSATGTAVEYQREDDDFNKNIEQELREVNDAIRESDDLDELRNMVIGRLDRVTTLLLDKRQDYQERINRSECERSKLLKNIDTVISDLQEQNRILEEQNRIDPLTGISNRRAFEERLHSELDRFQRYNALFSIIFFDIDHFKLVNDRYGHTAGDRALRGIAQCAGSALRKTDVLARYGGEEFVIILPETPIEKATQVAWKLHDLIQDTEFDYDGNIVPITISVGVTEVHDSDTDLGIILDRADQNTYRAKELGRNNVVSDKK